MSRQENRRLSVYDRVIKIVADPPISKKSLTIAPPPAQCSVQQESVKLPSHRKILNQYLVYSLKVYYLQVKYYSKYL